MKAFFSKWFPLLAYASLIFTMSSFVLRQTILTVGYGSYLMHALEFFVLTTLFLRVIYPQRYAFLLSILAAVSFGYFDELHQLFVSGRVFSLYDLFFDLLGASIVLIFKNQKLRKLLSV